MPSEDKGKNYVSVRAVSLGCESLVATIYRPFSRILPANQHDSRRSKRLFGPEESKCSCLADFCREFGKFGNAPSAGIRYAGDAFLRRSPAKRSIP